MSTKPNSKPDRWNEDEFSDLHSTLGLPYETLVDYALGKLDQSKQRMVEEFIASHPMEQAVLAGIRHLQQTGTETDKLVFKPDLAELHAKYKMRNLLEERTPELSLSNLTGLPHSNFSRTEESAFFSNYKKQLLKERTLEGAYKYICEMLRLALNCRSASIFLYGQEGILERKYISGFYRKLAPPPEKFRPGQGYVGNAVGTKDSYGELIYCNNAQEIAEIKEEDPELERYVENYRDSLFLQHGVEEEINHLIVIPLNAFYRSMGVLRVINKLDDTGEELAIDGFTQEDRMKIQHIAELGAITLSYLKLEKRENVLNDVPRLLDQYGTRKVFDKICESLINESTLYGGCIIRIVEPKNQYLLVEGSSIPKLEKNMLKIRVGKGIAGTTLYSNTPRIVKNLHANSENYLFKDWARQNDIESMICFPLKSMDRNINYGTLSVFTKFPFVFGEDDIKYLESFAAQIANIIELIQDEKEKKLLKNISEALIKKSSINEVLLDVSKDLPQLTGFDKCKFLLKTEKHLHMISRDSPNWTEISLDTVIGKMILENPTKIWRFHEVDEAEELVDVKDYLENIRTLVLVPISNSDNELYGLMAFASLKSREVHINTEERRSEIILNLVSKLNTDLLVTISNLFAASIGKIKEREAKEKAQNLLVEQQYLLRTLIENVNDLIYIKDTQHRFTLVNRAQVEVLGAESSDKVIGKTDLDFFPKEDAEKYHEAELALFSGKQEVIHKEEKVVNQTDGSIKTYSTIKTVRRNSMGEIIGLFGIGRDITELKNRVLNLIRENVASKKKAEVIKSRYEEYKHSVAIQCEKLIAEYRHDPRICLYARLIAADFFVGTELPAKYMSHMSLKPEQMSNETLDAVFEDEFKEIVRIIPQALGENVSIDINIDKERLQSFRLNKKQIQDIILSLVKNSLKYKIAGSSPKINIGTDGKYLSIKTDCQQSPGDMSKLKEAVAAKEYQNHGSSLFGIDKYFQENYHENIQIEYVDKEFTVYLPLIMN